MPGLGPVTVMEAKQLQLHLCLLHAPRFPLPSLSVCDCSRVRIFPEGFKNDILIKSIRARRKTTESGIGFFRRSGGGRYFIHLSLPSVEETSSNPAALWIFNCSVIGSKAVSPPANSAALPPSTPPCQPHSCLHYEDGASLPIADSSDLVVELLSENTNEWQTLPADLIM